MGLLLLLQSHHGGDRAALAPLSVVLSAGPSSPVTGFPSQSSCPQCPTCCARPFLDAIVAALICTGGAGWEGNFLE